MKIRALRGMLTRMRSLSWRGARAPEQSVHPVIPAKAGSQAARGGCQVPAAGFRLEGRDNIVVSAPRRGQSGMTFVELVIAFGLTGIILATIATTLGQMFNMNARNTNYMVAVRNAQSTGYWVTRDAGMSKTVKVTGLTSPKVLTLTWTDPTNYAVTHTVDYTLEAGTLWRKLDAGAKTMVANGISLPSAPTYAGDKLVFNVKATAGTPPRAGIETRRYEVTPRPGVQ